MGREKGAVVAGDGVAVDCRRGSSGSRGRTRGRVVVPWGRTVVPFHSRSYFGALLTYGRAGSGTTARRNVRPRASGYDRAGLPTTARPIRAGPARGTRSDAGPMPAGGRSSPACRVVPSSSTFRDESDDAAVGLVQECPTRGPGSRARRPRTDLGTEPDRSRRRKKEAEGRARGPGRLSSTRLGSALLSSGRLPRPGRPCGGPRMSSDPRSAPGTAP